MASTPYSNLPIPQMYKDPYYASSQDTLSTLGSNILTGKLPDFYSSIGQSNSPEFQKMLQSVIGNTQRGVQEQAAQGGTARSGTVNAATSDALSQVIPQLTYQDFQNAQQQKAGLLQFGSGVEQNIGQAGLQNQNSIATQQQNIFEDARQQQDSIDQYKKTAASAQGGMIGNIVGGIASIGLAPFTGGASLMALPGFAAGAAGAGGGGGNSGSSLANILPYLSSGGQGLAGYGTPMGGFGGNTAPFSPASQSFLAQPLRFS